MAARAFLFVLLLIFGSIPAWSRPPAEPKAPMTFYVVKGAPDACGHGCDRWIAVEGQIDGGAAARFRKFLQKVRDRSLPIYFSSPGGNVEQALAMGAMLRERAAVARVGRTVVSECGFEPQDGAACTRLKQSGRELHADLWTRGAACASACPYLILGAPTREIAPDAVLGVHSAKVTLRFTGPNGIVPTDQQRATAMQHAMARGDTMISAYITRMGADPGLLRVAHATRFESMHVLTREEIVRFGIDRRQFVETPWQFENGRRNLVSKTAVQRNETSGSYELSQLGIFCANADQFEVHLLRPAAAAESSMKISIAGEAGKPLTFISPPIRTSGVDAWGLRLSKAQVQALAARPDIELSEASVGSEGRRVSQSTRLSVEGFPAALATLLSTCPVPRRNEAIPVQTVAVPRPLEGTIPCDAFRASSLSKMPAWAEGCGGSKARAFNSRAGNLHAGEWKVPPPAVSRPPP